MRSIGWLVLLTACSRGSLHIRYDPIGSWTALAKDDWPRGEDYAADSRACTDEIRELLGDTLLLDGTFPEWKGPLTQGTATIGDLSIDISYAHNISGGASAWPLDQGYTFADGSRLNYLDLFTDRTLRVNTEAPGRTYCWTWFEQD